MLPNQAILWNPEDEKRFKYPLVFKDGMVTHCPYCGVEIGEYLTGYPPQCARCRGNLPNKPEQE